MTGQFSDTTDRDQRPTRRHAPLLGVEELIAECEAVRPPKHFYVGSNPYHRGHGHCQKPGCGRTAADPVHLDPGPSDFGCPS